MQRDRAESIIAFMTLTDRLKHVERRSRTFAPDGTPRQENSAEHSWHLALLAILMAPDAGQGVDIGHAMALLVTHDLVEIEAGDTDAFDAVGLATQAEREALAAGRLFATLPPDLGARLANLWAEFEARVTPEAQFAVACDRAQGFLQQVISGAVAWTERGLTRAQSLTRMQSAMDAHPAFAALIGRLYETAETESLLVP